MSLHSARPRSARRMPYLTVGLAAAGLALLAATPAVATAGVAAPVLLATSSANGAAQLTDVAPPAAPAGCNDAQLRERAAQTRLLDDEKANEQRVINTIFDGSAPDKLRAIRDRAQIILGRIAQLDARCAGGGNNGGGGGGNGGQAPAGGGDRVLAALDIECADVDFTGVDQARAQRAAGELARNENQLDARLAADFPRFSARVAREDDPNRARAEFAQLAANLADTLEARRVAILDRAAPGLAARFARTCEVTSPPAPSGS